MKTLTNIQATIVISTALVATAVQAHGDHVTSAIHANSLITEVVYDNPAYNRGIHGYPVLIAPLPIAEESMIYVDKAHGQAIYSYPGNTKQPQTADAIRCSAGAGIPRPNTQLHGPQ